MNYPLIEPILIEIGPLAVRWYGLMYLLAFLTCYVLGSQRAKRENSGWDKTDVSDVIFYGVVGTIVGGRLGFVLFYSFDRFLVEPLWLFRLWEGGMSFHGGLLGVITALWLYGRKTSRGFWAVADFAGPLVPIGLGFGRIGNFINAELPGRITESPLGVHFPCGSLSGVNLTCFGQWDIELRHLSSLYQAFGEGVVLFMIVWLFSLQARRSGLISGMFLTAYGVIRFVTEWFREPDAAIGFIAFDWLTMGQLLSLPMIVFGILLLSGFAQDYFEGLRRK
tara:strand:- start:1279 stop:2115 length:837 start_codon:yes stop_codon:yes gene_type:complete